VKRVLVAGEINVDLVFGGCSAMPQPDTEILAQSFRQVPGSSSMICAIGLSRLGQPVRFAGCAGDDAHGAFCIGAMREAGIDVEAVTRRADLVTGVTVAISTASDRALVTCAGSIGALTAEDIDDALLARADHLHVSSFYLQSGLRPRLTALMQRARSADLTTSLDPGFDPAQRWREGNEWPTPLEAVDVFLPSRREALAISGMDDVEAALQWLDDRGTRSVIKCGPDGAVTRDDAGALLHVAPRPPERFLDATGAGDSFDAGFLHAWLAERPLRECLRWGNACGSLSTRGIGGTACQPDAPEVQAWLEAAP
jgi:sugar/nucleoside kinase (ribokinase family)